MPERGVCVVLVVELHVYLWKLARAVVDGRFAVVRRESLDRLPDVAAVGVAVGEQSVDARRATAEIQAGLDAFVEHCVRAHLDADERSDGRRARSGLHRANGGRRG